MLPSFNIDLILIILFLTISLFIGLWYGKDVQSMQDYALGGRKFNTAALTATVIATWISGSAFSIGLSEIYRVGILRIVMLGQVLYLLTVAYILAPRMQEFLGKLSVAEVMGDLYGKHVRIITAISSIVMSAGFIAIQIKVFSNIFNYFFEINSIYATLISSIIVIIYSAFGGIRAVVFTDIFQFLTFGSFIPVLALLVWIAFGNWEYIINMVTTNPIFDPRQLLDYSNPTIIARYGLFFYYAVPSINPAMFQRALIAKNTQQISTSFKISAVIFLLFSLFICFIGIIILSISPGLEPNNLVMHIVDSYSYPGFKGLLVVGIAAMIMSTADSWINSASIIFVNDLCKPLRLLDSSKLDELKLVRIFAILIGSMALVMALSQQNLLNILLLGASFYNPVVGIPLSITILGFRSSTKVILSGMISGVVASVVWNKYFEPSFPIGNIMPATIVNFVVMMIVHYLLKEPGGWVGPKDRTPLDIIKADCQRRKNQIYNFFMLLPSKFKWDYIVNYCINNSLDSEHHYIFFGIFIALSSTIMLFMNDSKNFLLLHNLQAISFFVAILLGVAASFVVCKLWSVEFQRKYIGLIWHVSVFYGLVFVNTILVMVSNFAKIQLVCFVVNLMVVGILVRWRVALFMIILGISLGIWVFGIFSGHVNFILGTMYALLLVGGVKMMFLKD